MKIPEDKIKKLKLKYSNPEVLITDYIDSLINESDFIDELIKSFAECFIANRGIPYHIPVLQKERQSMNAILNYFRIKYP